MSEEETEQVDEQNPTETEVEEATNEPADEEAQESDESKSNEDEEGNEDSGDEGGDELPKWARDKLTKANAEAANYRTKLRDAEKLLESAKSLEEVDELISQMREDRESAERELLIENVALKYKLPEALMKRLTGSTREELESDAKELSELFGTEDEEEEIGLEGGLSPRKDAEDNDPRSLAQKYGRGRKRPF